jgi:uncharacterized protein (TIGR03382 family)
MITPTRCVSAMNEERRADISALSVAAAGTTQNRGAHRPRVARDLGGRLVLSAAVGLITVWFVLTLSVRPNVHTDFEVLWTAARMWTAGQDPYAMHPCCLFYPLPAVMLVWPIHWLSLGVATAIFVAAPATLLAWRLSRDALWPLLALASPSFVMAAVLGQWSPWLLLAMLWPSLGFFFTSKPTLGAACFTYKPAVSAVIGGAGILLLSLALSPSWPLLWLRNLKSVIEHPAPIAAPFGVLLLLALLRWRRRESRLLLAMALVPQLLLFADQLPLMLVARSAREAMLLTLGGWIAAIFWYVQEADKFGAVGFAAPYVLAGCYLPALWIVLRQLNTGEIPAWLEDRVRTWPAWLRGGQ